MTTSALSVVLVAGLLALGGCGDDNPGKPPANSSLSGDSDLTGRLLFSRFDEGTHTFISTHVSRADGSEETELQMPGPEGGGQWSHSGSHIAVMTVLPDDRIGTAIITAEGKVERVLKIPDATLNLVCTVWSPDDTRLACEGWDDSTPSRGGIYSVRSADGGALERITTTPSGVVDLPGDYSPDGRTFLFKRAPDETEGPLMLVPAEGGKPKQLTEQLVEDPGRYSPDGSTILTSAEGSIVLLDEQGALIDDFSVESHVLFGPVWSPDGTHIAYSSAGGGPHADVWTALPDGSDPHRVTSTPENEIVVEWGADPS